MASRVMQKGSFDGVEPDRHGGISKRTIELDGVRATQVSFEPGARWSVDFGPDAGTMTCQLTHLALMVYGTLHVRMDDGTEQEFGPNEVMMLPAGHDSWPAGDGGCAFVEFSRVDDYYNT